MCKTYITPSLLDSFCNGYDWVGMIKREEKEINQAIQNGIDFEQAVMNREFEELNCYVDNCLYQPMLYGQFDKYYLFGYADIVKDNVIIDLKFKKSYEFPHYYNSNQYLIYTALTDINEFMYIIGTGSNPHSPNAIYFEKYNRNDNLLLSRLNQLNNAIDRFGLRNIFNQNYSYERIRERINNSNI